ncbi:MAG TPA: T9SS type A sorting domain-containing protein, partial [bacterium]
HWQDDGVVVNTWDVTQADQRVCSDDTGGGYVLWRNYDDDLLVQHLDANGNRLFGDTGVYLTSTVEDEIPDALVADGAGCAIAFYRYEQIDGLYAKRVLPSGAVDWTITVCQYYLGEPVAIPAHDGGAIVTWQDARAGSVTDIYAQKIDTAGAMLWAPNGAAVVVWPAHQMYPQLLEDADGFVYFAWENALSDVYCQRLNPQGVQQFPPSGLIVCRAPDYQQDQKIVADGAGGALFCWADYREVVDIYATHYDSQGQIADPFWVWNGNPICNAPVNQNYPQMVSDGAGGAVMAWADSRGLYAQRINDFVSMREMAIALTPQNSLLLRNSPNPFNPTTAISYQLEASNHVSLKVHDIAGRLVATLVGGWREAGMHEITFDGSGLPSGIYIYRVATESWSETGKMILLK